MCQSILPCCAAAAGSWPIVAAASPSYSEGIVEDESAFPSASCAPTEPDVEVVQADPEVAAAVQADPDVAAAVQANPEVAAVINENDASMPVAVPFGIAGNTP